MVMQDEGNDVCMDASILKYLFEITISIFVYSINQFKLHAFNDNLDDDINLHELIC